MGEESAKLLSRKTTFPWSAYTRPEMTEPEIVSSPAAPVLLRTSEPSLRSSLPVTLSVPPG